MATYLDIFIYSNKFLDFVNVNKFIIAKFTKYLIDADLLIIDLMQEF